MENQKWHYVKLKRENLFQVILEMKTIILSQIKHRLQTFYSQHNQIFRFQQMHPTIFFFFFQKNISVTLRSWWDSDRIETIIDPVQHSAISLSVSLEVFSQYLCIQQNIHVGRTVHAHECQKCIQYDFLVLSK